MRTRLLVSFLTAMALSAAACASPSDEDAAASEGAMSAPLAGAFTVNLDGHKVKFDYEMTYDIPARKVVWNAKVKDADGHPNVWDDENEPGEMTAVARCGCTFTATIAGHSGKLARVSVADSKVVSIEYEGERTILSEASAPTADAPSSSDFGACTLTTSSGTRCKEIEKSLCKAGERGDPFPAERGRMEFAFVAGGRCE